jgi:hypothetical protein
MGVPPTTFAWFARVFVGSFSDKVTVVFMPGFQFLLPANCLLRILYFPQISGQLQ